MPQGQTIGKHSSSAQRTVAQVVVLLAPPSPPRSLQRFIQPPNPSLSNRLTPPGSRTHHESGRISSIHGLGQETGNMIVRSPDTYHDFFRLVRSPKNLKCFLPGYYDCPCHAHIFRWRVLTTSSVSKSISRQWGHPSRMGAPRTLPARRSPPPQPTVFPSSPRVWYQMQSWIRQRNLRGSGRRRKQGQLTRPASNL
jgi:hypothetical protein